MRLEPLRSLTARPAFDDDRGPIALQQGCHPHQHLNVMTLGIDLDQT